MLNLKHKRRCSVILLISITRFQTNEINTMIQQYNFQTLPTIQFPNPEQQFCSKYCITCALLQYKNEKKQFLTLSCGSHIFVNCSWPSNGPIRLWENEVVFFPVCQCLLLLSSTKIGPFYITELHLQKFSENNWLLVFLRMRRMLSA